VACGGLAKVFLRHFGIEVLSHTTAIGEARLPHDRTISWEQLESIRDDEVVRCIDPEIGKHMVSEIEKAQKDGDTIGGTFEVVARGVPLGLGSHTGWETRLDRKLARYVRKCCQAVEVARVSAAHSPGLPGARRDCLR
jgi:chorismate synthase